MNSTSEASSEHFLLLGSSVQVRLELLSTCHYWAVARCSPNCVRCLQRKQKPLLYSHIVIPYTAGSHGRPVCPLNKPLTSRGLLASRHSQLLPSCTLYLPGNKPKVAEKSLPDQLQFRKSWQQVLCPVDSGGAEGIRTPDLLRAREALSQLSYSPKHQAIIANLSITLLSTSPGLKFSTARSTSRLTHPEM